MASGAYLLHTSKTHLKAAAAATATDTCSKDKPADGCRDGAPREGRVLRSADAARAEKKEQGRERRLRVGVHREVKRWVN